MKKIGIIGGLSPESTIEYYRFITRTYNRLVGGISSPNVIIDSLDLAKVTAWMDKKDYESLLEELIKSAKNLVAAGAEVVIMATNTPHIVFHSLEKKVSVKIISIMDATAKQVKNKGLKKVGLVGTRFTMQNDFYQKTFDKYQIAIIVPSLEDQAIIDKILWEELVYHKLYSESKKAYLEVFERMIQRGAEGIILGCTEIPLLIKQEDCDYSVFDTTIIHAQAVLNYAVYGSRD